jgi:hypothetical protein
MFSNNYLTDTTNGLVDALSDFKRASDYLVAESLQMPLISDNYTWTNENLSQAQERAYEIVNSWARFRREIDDIIFLLNTYIKNAEKLKETK